MDAPEYEPLYLAGILFFNRRDFFEAHEVWEDLWNNCSDVDRRFYQALIQAAVGLYHYGNGNLQGATKLYRTSKAYMDRYASPHLGLDCDAFWRQMAICFVPVHAETNLLRRDLRPDEALIPTITLDPPPAAWPDPEEFLEEDEE
jgi:predicted metal-dependent hydrolase